MERFSPLLAVYSGDRRLTKDLPNKFNLVNLCRFVFNELFDAELPLLPSHSYFDPWNDPRNFQEVAPKQLNSVGPTCTTSSLDLPRGVAGRFGLGQCDSNTKVNTPRQVGNLETTGLCEAQSPQRPNVNPR
jgi:hypothetical protein